MGGQASFHVDSKSALYGSSGLWAMDLSEPISRTLRGLIQSLHSMGRLPVGFAEHVQAHAGHPFNELADRLAKHCIAHRLASPLPPWQIIPDGTGALFDHLWLQFEKLTRSDSLPHSANGAFIATGHGRFPELGPAGSWTGSDAALPKASRASKVIGLRFVSANVQTLQDPEGAEFSGRAAFIRSQFEWHQVTIAAIQEARSKHSATFVSSNFVRLCSGCSQTGHLGVELWFSRTPSWTFDGLPRPTFELDDLVVLHSDPRTMTVRACNSGFRAVVVAVHAPTQQDPEREAWWSTLLRRLRTFVRGCYG